MNTLHTNILSVGFILIAVLIFVSCSDRTNEKSLPACGV